MQSLFLFGMWLFAQAEQANPKGDAGEPSFWDVMVRSPLLPMILVFVMLYLLVLRPKQVQERKQREQMLASLKKNDKVLTVSGIIGVVANISEGKDQVTLRLEEGKVRVLASSIAQILSDEGAGTGT